MVDIPQLFLATSVVKPLGQTFLFGDHRQLSSISKVDWAESYRKNVVEAGAHLSALDYIRMLTQPHDLNSGLAFTDSTPFPTRGLLNPLRNPTAGSDGGDTREE